MNKKWWKESVAYQVYPRSFMDSNGDGIGDLKGVTSKLDYLKELGIDVIWLSPMYKSPNDDNGYDISDYQDIMDEFGTMADFDELLEEVHKRGMKLILDLVINHTSDEHPWFIESRSSKDNPKRDWYIWREGKDGKEPNNWESIFSGSAWKYDEETAQYFMHIFSARQPDLNWENPEVRNALHDMVNWWLDKGIDGFRVDAISHIKKESGFPDMPNPENQDYVSCFPYMMNVEGIDDWLTELSQKTIKNYDVMTVGEANGVGLDDADRWVGEENGYFNMIFQFEFLGLWDKDSEGRVNVRALKKNLTKWQMGLEGKGWNALFIENHDQPRRVSSWGNEQEYWKESAKMLGAMYFLMKGTPFIYQGQEIGMTNVQFPSIEDYNDVGMVNYYKIETAKGRSHDEIMDIIWKQCRDNARTPMQWDATNKGGFTTADQTWLGVNPNYTEINIEAQVNDPDSILSFYKKLIRLRKDNPLFVYGTYELLLANHPKLFVYTRRLGKHKAVVINNFSEKSTRFRVPGGLSYSNSKLVLHNYDVADKKLRKDSTLKPYETRVYLLK
ncbi:alpha-glucosidase [Bacillus sp. ISL-40]|uniref:glycoside hydrolase family 13 protein n=1 Tax=unclassified Bacillus (in: firmicutes) TaxID=185979 RepID=UPI001BE523B1|nr:MULTISPECIES: alpha-glucosidase [unclassified Bacillus (in: firmicutes)]MBT2697421.1 alpha-glucosidase [Bacillus sp. ISL-40]MBT2721029.1 alpha-glucosidase [Bacillus sp. ISL-46]MBT2741763.1 alpha-glucosidase [Bacillus sp. ISL-77]